MASNKFPYKSVELVSSPISQVFGSTPVLPGESEVIYRQGLLATLQELGATTPLQTYLAEKIYECLWWMRRYENQKHATLIQSMASILDPGGNSSRGVSELEAWTMEALFANRIDDEFRALMDEHRYTMESLTQRAMAKSRSAFEDLDQMITLNAKTLAGFQASYEVLVHRKVNAQRLRLQNALMQRDLGSIDSELVMGDDDQRTEAAGK